MSDVRYGLRMLLKNPFLTGVAGLSLAVGIAVNAASFATVEAFLFVPLPYEDQESLTWVWHENVRRDIEQGGVPVGTFLEIDREGGAYRSLAGYTTGQANLTGRDRPEQVLVMTTTPDLFRTLGVQPALGRDFRPEEGVEGSDRVAILHHDFWTARLAADPDVLGQTLTVDGTPLTVVGVMPESFDPVPANTDIFRPSDFREGIGRYAGPGMIVVGRLRSGSDAEAADRALETVQSRLVAEHPEDLEGWTLRVQPARDLMPGPTDQRLVLILTAVTLFGLVIACANVANLLLSRAETRTREVAIRTAMGADRGRIVRQLLTESLVLAVVAGVVGTLGSHWILVGFRTAFPPEMPDVFIPVLRPATLAAVLAVTLGSGILFGLVPALSVVRSDIRSVLGEGSRGGTAGRGRKRVRSAFVVTEFAVALALLTGAAFLTRAFDQVVAADGGFRSEGVLTFTVSLPEARYPDDAAVARFDDRVVEALLADPAIDEAALMTSLPRGRDVAWAPYEIEGRPVASPSDRPRAVRELVSPGWFDLLEVQVREGRAVTPADRADAPPVAVVNRAFAEREFQEGDAVGQRVVVDGVARSVVGVVEDVMHARIQEPGVGTAAAVYVPMAQAPRRTVTVGVRGPGAPESLTGVVREAVWSVDPDLPVGNVTTLDAAISASLAGPRVIGLFLTFIGAVALLLAAMGIYGVLAHAVVLRRRELGIRMALGAGRSSVLGMVARDGLVLAGIGLVVGLPLAAGMYVAVARALAGLAEVADPVTAIAGIAAVLVGVATVACLVPAVRATRVDPVNALSE